MSSTVFWYNGNLERGDRISVSITDPALLYGATHFTTLRIYNQTLNHPLTHWPQHLQRLKQTPPYFTEPDWQQIIQGAEQLSSFYEVLRITLFPDGRELITGRSLPPDLTDRQTQGITALLLEPDQTRSLPQYKTGNYLAPWLALKEAQHQNCQEAIFTDIQGNWLETTTGNLWGYSNGSWYTPPLSAGILPGIQRSFILDRLKLHNQPVEESIWSCDRILQFDCIAYSNCVVELVPIHTTTTQDSSVRSQNHQVDLDQINQLRNYFKNSTPR